MKQKTYIWLGIAVALLLGLCYLWLGRSLTLVSLATQQRCTLDTCFSLEIAKTPEQRSQGLMFRTKLEKKSGMVFVFGEAARHPFWMKNTDIPLDMIRLDSGYKIVDIQEAKPCTQDPCMIYMPVADANYVIELNQGIAKSLGLKPGNLFSPVK